MMAMSIRASLTWSMVMSHFMLNLEKDSSTKPKQIGASNRIRFERGPFDQGVVLGVAPTGAIVGAVADEDIEERVGVEIVADPRGSRDVVPKPALIAQIASPLLLTESDLDTELSTPLGLDHLGDHLVERVGVVEKLERGKGDAG